MKETISGFGGRILRVNLTGSEIAKEPTEQYAKRFLGGRGINQWILLKEMKPWITPFEPASTLCFGAGALTGTLVPGASRINIDSKNPFTGGIASSSAGGWFASELKFAGFDNIVVKGKAKTPVYLWIDDDHVSLRSAEKIWGSNVLETEKQIKEDLGLDGVQALCIGPAGENMVRSACVVVSGARTAGRCGLGAVMGSKNLKAIAVRGTGGVQIKHPEEFLSLFKKVSRRLQKSPEHQMRKEMGTLFVTPKFNDLSAVPYKNFEDDFLPEESYKKISHEVFHDIHQVDTYGCSSCPTPCGHTYHVEKGPYAGTVCQKIEANTVWNFGGKLAIDEPTAILKAQEKCCQLGLDIDVTSGVIAWAIDTYQNELISKQDTDGLDLNWGDHGVILKLIEKMAHRQGFGNILAEGSFRASQMIGKGSEKYAFHVKGQDNIEAIRSMKGWALGIGVSPRGGAHTRGAPVTEARKYSEQDSKKLFGVKTAGKAETYEGKAQIVTYIEKLCALLDSHGVCLFTGTWASPLGVNVQELAKFFYFATGIKLSEKQMLKTGERIHNLEKIFNVYHAGFTRLDDYPPKRFMEEPVKSGPLKGEILNKTDWDRMLDEYYTLNGWDVQSSWPTEKKLEELNLEECIEMLQAAEKDLEDKKEKLCAAV
ncbi:MAG: aldehyde ferredoxin oxidoreductase family protein [Desulfobacteraceae bacterium]